MDNQDNQKKKRKKAAAGGDAGDEERKMRARSLAYEKRRGQTQITDDTDSFYDPSRTARAYAVRVDSIQSSVTSVYLCRRLSEKPATFLPERYYLSPSLQPPFSAGGEG